VIYRKLTSFIAVTAVLTISGYFSVSEAQVMESANYRIQSDSVNIGGILASSTNYKIEDTVGEIATGESTSASYKLKAGYQQMQETFISISSPSDVTMTPLTVTQNTAVGSATWTVITDNAAGYTLSANATGTPALRDLGTGEQFADYTEAIPGSKETWSVTNAYEFGFSGYGGDVTGYGSDSDCVAGADVPSATLLWEGFEGATAIQLASSTSRTPVAGTDSTICVAVEQDTALAPSGSYQATIVVTAVSL